MSALAGSPKMLALMAFGVFLAVVVAGWLASVLWGSASKLQRSISLAVKSLWLHKLRSFLSVLGIIIGTSSVITLMAFGEGSMQDALEDIKRQGATNIIVRSVKPPDDGSGEASYVTEYGLVESDLERFKTLGDVVVRMVPLRIFPTDAWHLNNKVQSRVIATTPEYADVHALPFASGRFLLMEDDSERKNVCVLGSEAADELFPFDDPIGESVILNSHSFVVVGVLRSRMPTGGTGGSQAAEEFNKDIYIPLATSVARFGEIIATRKAGSRSAEDVEFHQVTLTVASMDKVRPVGEEIKRILEEEHGEKEDWAVTIPLDKLEEAERTKSRITKLMAMIASISLLVGGIGIMNIMLATVTERTREIGIRRALGAKQGDITLQFLIEAIVQTVIGGLCGVVMGITAVFVVPEVWAQLLAWGWFEGSELPAKLHVPAIFLALFVSVGVGVLFGWYPARQAAKLDPIEALRHD